MENEKLEIILKMLFEQNQFIIRQNAHIIEFIDSFNEASTYRHGISYTKSVYKEIEDSSNKILGVMENMKQTLFQEEEAKHL